ncbi:MAG TPA: hypothetical protein VEQ42_13700 [Pyrinomonadaceae bacterium]|nr:hypothetical protein [Pyrinomonadaceae bacterium]
MKACLLKVALVLALCALPSAAARGQGGEGPLTNASVIKLVRAGFGEKTVITIIRTRPARFDLSPDRLIELKKNGVSEKVILAMLARDGAQAATEDDGWDEDFFGDDSSRRTPNGAGGAARGSGQGELGIFGSSGGSRNRSRSTTGTGGGSEDTETTGSATVRIIRPPVEAGVTPPRLERTPTLNNESVVELVEAGFSEGTIIRRIEQSPVAFDLAPAKLAELRRRRVSEPVINAMKTAMADEAAPASPQQ